MAIVSGVLQVLANYWWQYLVPAKHALAQGDSQELDDRRPAAEHPSTAWLRNRSKQMVAEAHGVFFGPERAD